jgi:LPXTG-motif cell wall-anchored protein
VTLARSGRRELPFRTERIVSDQDASASRKGPSPVRIRTTLLAAICAMAMSVAVSGQAAAGSITSPTGTPEHPFHVPADSHDDPVVFTIAGSGWSRGQPVYVEQCDGVPPTATGWDPAGDCDTETSPAAALADAHGNVTFLSTSHNYAAPVFRGASPQGLFNCLSPKQPDPHNGLPTFRTCQLRISSSNTNGTSDQAFISIVLPDSSHGYPATSQASVPGLGPPGLAGARANAAGGNGPGANGAGASGPGPSTTGSDAASSPSGSGASAVSHSSGSSGGWLASTGAKILLILLIGLLLLAIGLLLAWRHRRQQLA